jgi:hypothetical protein
MDVFRHPPALQRSDSGAYSYPLITYNTLVALDLAQCALELSRRAQISQVLSTFNPDNSSQLGSMKAKISALASEVRGNAASCPGSNKPAQVTVILFPKRNLTDDTVEKLEAALPKNYSFRMGKGMVGTGFGADTIFVDRDWVPVRSLVEVMQVLADQGITIRYVQQVVLRGPEIQIGSVAIGEDQVHAKLRPLNVTQLSKLNGADFWLASMNGEAWCEEAPLHQPFRCQFSANARPIPSE